MVIGAFNSGLSFYGNIFMQAFIVILTTIIISYINIQIFI